MKYLLLSFYIISCTLILEGQHTEPILRLNTPMHTAKIGRISSDSDGKYILTCSRDKTAKLWDVSNGKLLKTFRPPIGLGNEGMLFAGAISPDGQWVVVGGWSAYYPQNKSMDIYIFNTQSGLLKERITGLPNVIFDLEFSPNGQYLVAALGGSNGIRIYRSRTFQLLKKDSDYGDYSYNIAFSKEGTLASVCDDGYLRLYNKSFDLIKKQKMTGGEQPFSLAFSPDGRLLAVTYRDSPNLQVLDPTSLQVLYKPIITGANTLNQSLFNVAFSKDGTQLIAGGFYKIKQNGKWWYQIRIWNKAGQGSYQDYAASESTIMDIKVLSNGQIAYASTQPDWGILDTYTGKQVVYQGAAINDYAVTNRSHLKINADAFEVGLTPKYKDPLIFDLNTRSISETSANFPSFKEKIETIEITDWENTYQPKLNHQNLSFLKSNEMCRSVDISDNQETIVFGASYTIYGLDARGKQVWETPTQSTVWAVNIAANNKVVVAALGDGTIRWYRMTDGAHLLTLFLHPDRQRWILWTASGYYDAAPGAEDLLGWQVNQGADKEGLFYPVSKFRKTYYRPDVIDRILDTQDEAEALALANKTAHRSSPSSSRDITKELPPTVRLLSPSNGTTVQSNTVSIEYSIQSPNNEAVTGVSIKIDGRPVSTDRGLKSAGQREKVQVTIPSSNCTVSIFAENRFGISEAASVDLVWEGQLRITPELMRPNLYILAIGVSDYDVDNYDLDFPDDDAKAFVKVLERQEGLLYNKVVPKLYTDKTATKDNILDGLDWLVRETTQHDVAMIFFAGHGRENTQGTFYYLPVGADENNMRRTCIMKEEIRETVATIAGKVLVFMDACHSGHLMLASNRRGSEPDINRIINELVAAENGAVVFSSSTGRQSSLENALWGHGAFTKALVEGLSGEAKYGDEGKVTCKSLDYYISKRVKELTNGKQSPTTNFPPNVPDFPIAILKK